MLHLLILLAICYVLVALAASIVIFVHNPGARCPAGMFAASAIGLVWLPCLILASISAFRRPACNIFRCANCYEKLPARPADMDSGELRCKHCGSRYFGSSEYGFGNANGTLELWS